APEQEARARGRIPDREPRAPPGLVAVLLVNLRGDRARLAVLHVAQQHPVHRDRRRNAQPRDGRPAELVRRLEVQLGAVVMRLERHPLTEPCVSPCTMNLGGEMKRTTAGTAARRTPAEKGTPPCAFCGYTKVWMTIG